MNPAFSNTNLPIWKQAPFLPLLFFLVLGILLQEQFKILHSYTLIGFLIIAFLLVFFLVLRRRFKITNKLKAVLAAVLMTLLGILLVFVNHEPNNPRWFVHHQSDARAFKIRLIEEAQEKPKTMLLTANVEEVLLNRQWQKCNGKLLVYVYKSDSLPDYKLGLQILIPNNLVAIKHNNNPFSFNYAKNKQRNGFYVQSFLSSDQIKILELPRKVPLLIKVRAHLLHILNSHIPDNETKQLTAATLLNERAGLDDFIQDAYSNTGITHIIAISGMHVNLLFYIMLLLMFWIRKRKYLWVKYVLAIPFVWFYIMLTGAPPSALRAAIMFSLIALSVGINRPMNGINLLAFTAFFMFCLQPLWIYHIGVQLSFLAVLSIFIFYQPLYRLIRIDNWLLNKIWQTVAVSLAVQVLVFPLVIYYFHQFPIWFLPANFFAALFSLLLMGLALLIILFGLLKLSFIATFLGKLLVMVTKAFHTIVIWMNAHSWDASRLLALDGVDYWLMMSIIVLAGIFFLRKVKWTLYAALGMLSLFFINLFLQDIMASRQKAFIVYAYNNHTLLQLVEGRTAHLFSDTVLDERSQRFALRPAFLGYRIKHIKPLKATQPLTLAGMQLQWLGAEDLPIKKGAVLVVSKFTKFQPELWQHAAPKLIVIDNSLPRWKSLKWAETLHQMGIPVHNVREQGAWILAKK